MVDASLDVMLVVLMLSLLMLLVLIHNDIVTMPAVMTEGGAAAVFADSKWR